MFNVNYNIKVAKLYSYSFMNLFLSETISIIRNIYVVTIKGNLCLFTYMVILTIHIHYKWPLAVLFHSEVLYTN